MEWYEKYRGASEADVITQALDACSRHDCGCCLYQGKGICCLNRLKIDAKNLIIEMKKEALQ